MQTVSNDYKSLLNTSISISPKSKIVVNNVEYEGDVIKTSPKISHSNTSFIGGFPAKTLSFDIYNLNNNLDFENKEIIIYKGLVVNGSIEWVKQGVFIPQAKDITNNVSTKVMTISNAQDKTQLLDDKYESSLDWSNNATHTGLEIVQEICTKKNITLETTNFAWANYSFKQPNFNETATYREVISRLAEIGGEIALFTSNGDLAIKGQYATGDTIQRQRYEKLSKENTYTINTIVLGKEGIDDDIIYPETITGDRAEFRIEDNPFVNLNREEMISLVANYIVGKSYTPFNLNGFVDGFIYELNDVVSVVDKNGNTLNAVILDYSSSSRIKSTIKAETQDKNTTNYNLAGSKKEAINQVKLEVDHINNTITALSSRIEDLTDYLRTVTGTNTIILTDTVESTGSIGKLVMTGFAEIGLYPNMVYPSEKVYPGKLTTYIIIQSNSDNSKIHETYIDLGMVLTSTDELIIENNKVYVKSGNTTTDMNMSVLLNTYNENTKISIKYFDNINFTCDYIIKNDLTKAFATQAEVSAQFNITNESINSKVSKAEVISEINQSAEQVSIKAEKISLEGIVTANNNFKVLLDGSIEAKNGSFTGNIFLQDGNRVIGGDGILTNLQYSTAGVYGGYDILGFEHDDNGGGSFASRVKDISLDVYIPENFTIVEAKVTLFHTPADWYLYNQSTNDYSELWGYCRNIKLFKSDGTENYQFIMGYYSEYKLELDTSSLEELTNALGTNGYTATNTSGSSIQTTISSNIKDYLTTGNNKIVLRSTLANPTTESDMLSKSGMARAVINIIGYMSM